MSLCALAACVSPAPMHLTPATNLSATIPTRLGAHPDAAFQLRDDGSALCCGPVTPAASRVLRVLNASGIDRLWANGRHVNWETGIADEPVGYTGPNKSTHCSCFVAAMAKRLGIYLLRPPEHSQQLLANAQFTWLHGQEAQRLGWTKVMGRENAQRMANQGAFVIAAVQNSNPHRAGHITIVRPEALTWTQIRTDGLVVAHSGFRNSVQVSEKTGFERHEGAWPDGISYFVHPVP